jgi:hypothetical protein
LAVEDVEALEAIVARIAGSTGTRPSVGQMASVIVRKYLAELAPDQEGHVSARVQAETTLPAWQKLFPSVPGLQEVAARAALVAERELPLMMADAA